MSTQQTEALRLADWLFDNVEHMNHADAAAELRRLHEEVERLRMMVPDVEFAREAIYCKAEGREA